MKPSSSTPAGRVGTHRTHKMRYSDSSVYDEVCERCGQADPALWTNPKLEEPCKGKEKSNG